MNMEETIDSTEDVRRALVPIVNSQELTREALEARHGQVYDTAQMREAFDVLSFAAPLVVVRRLSDGVKGSLYFTHDPRFYYGFEPA